MTAPRPLRRLSPLAVGVALVLLLGALLAGLLVGAVGLSPGAVLAEVADRLPFVSVDSGLSEQEAAIVWDLRLPRVVLAALVGATLAAAGASPTRGSSATRWPTPTCWGWPPGPAWEPRSGS